MKLCSCMKLYLNISRPMNEQVQYRHGRRIFTKCITSQLIIYQTDKNQDVSKEDRVPNGYFHKGVFSSVPTIFCRISLKERSNSVNYCKKEIMKFLCSRHNNAIVLICTICPGSSDPFYIVTYYIKWVTTSWTHSISFAPPDVAFPWRLFSGHVFS